MTANEIALTAVKALDSKKGQDIKCLEKSDRSHVVL